ncbi:beta-lactamase superfamily hydrolase [Candidatus Phycorickettsia trachydisci]|uniref:Beta-lactamase superfamily hydrolase n=1 Tax=Candidatus Phycorickettsia trachydisci TaxID=2115978 RepID=A0A2P1P7B5_9RICK|nr:MBL fold metallo-hydrolase [Candidatus Phycorickettsia trachydisci]AVP87159.1 beta-lactamase superfamily hydrolase [Candidatus Phycorickettsia trachydisci]
MLQITVLGCGSSLGTPVIGCKCETCSSSDPKNKRLRSAILITKFHPNDSKTNILIDSGFDVRTQLLRAGVSKLDATIITHDHADHISGLDELRVFSPLGSNKILPIYFTSATGARIIPRYQYLFDNKNLNANTIEYDSSINICDVSISFFKQNHIVMDSLGIRINNFVYANDVAFFYDESLRYLDNIDTFVIDCCDYQSTRVHAGLDRVLSWINQFKPKVTYLTNLSHKIDYYKIKNMLPVNVYPAYDGLVFKI